MKKSVNRLAKDGKLVVPMDKVKVLKTSQHAAQLLERRYQAAVTQYELAQAEALDSVGLPPATKAVICYECGQVRLVDSLPVGGNGQRVLTPCSCQQKDVKPEEKADGAQA